MSPPVYTKDETLGRRDSGERIRECGVRRLERSHNQWPGCAID